MKRLCLAVLMLSLVWAPSTANAIIISYTSNIGANGTSCDTSGYISPSTDTQNQGQVVEITFKNEQATPLQIRNFAGQPAFTVAGNTEVSRTFTASTTFTYSAWLTSPVCEKTSATITVNPAPPSSSSAPASSPTPRPANLPNTSQSANDAAAESSINGATESNALGQSDSDNKTKSFPWWLLLILPVVLAAAGYILKRRKNRQP